MKRFLISAAISAFCIVIGVTSLFFELSDFEIIYDQKETIYDKNMTEYKFSLNENEIFEIESSDYIYVNWIEDESLKNEVRISVSSQLQTSQHGRNKLEVEGYHWRFDNVLSMGETFLNNLKDHKIYVYDGHDRGDRIIIRCSSQMRDNIIIDY